MTSTVARFVSTSDGLPVPVEAVGAAVRTEPSGEGEETDRMLFAFQAYLKALDECVIGAR